MQPNIPDTEKVKIPILINNSYGGFKLPDDIVEKWGMKSKYSSFDRANIDIVNSVQTHKNNCIIVNCVCKSIKIEWILEDYRNYWEISEYDGLEKIILLDAEKERDELLYINKQLVDESKQLKEIIANLRGIINKIDLGF